MSEVGQPKIKELTSLLRRLEQVQQDEPELHMRSDPEAAQDVSGAPASEALVPPFANDDDAMVEAASVSEEIASGLNEYGAAPDELASLKRSEVSSIGQWPTSATGSREIAVRSDPQVPVQQHYRDLDKELAAVAALGQSLAPRAQPVEEKATVGLGAVVLAVGASALVSMAATLFLAQRFLVPAQLSQPVVVSDAGLIVPRPALVDPDVLNALPASSELPITQPKGVELGRDMTVGAEATGAGQIAVPVLSAQSSSQLDKSDQTSSSLSGREPVATVDVLGQSTDGGREGTSAAGLQAPATEHTASNVNSDDPIGARVPEVATPETVRSEKNEPRDAAAPGMRDRETASTQTAVAVAPPPPDAKPETPDKPSAAPSDVAVAGRGVNGPASVEHDSESSEQDAKFPLSVPSHWIAPAGGPRPVPFQLASSSADKYRVIVAGLEQDARIVGGTDITQGIWMIDGEKLSNARLIRGANPPENGQIIVELREASGDLVGRRRTILTSRASD